MICNIKEALSTHVGKARRTGLLFARRPLLRLHIRPHRTGDHARHIVCCPARAVVSEVRVALGRRGILVAEQRADHGPRQSGGDAETRKAVAQIMDTHVLDAGFLPYRAPVFLDPLKRRRAGRGGKDRGPVLSWPIRKELERNAGEGCSGPSSSNWRLSSPATSTRSQPD